MYLHLSISERPCSQYIPHTHNVSYCYHTPHWNYNKDVLHLNDKKEEEELLYHLVIYSADKSTQTIYRHFVYVSPFFLGYLQNKDFRSLRKTERIRNTAPSGHTLLRAVNCSKMRNIFWNFAVVPAKYAHIVLEMYIYVWDFQQHFFLPRDVK